MNIIENKYRLLILFILGVGIVVAIRYSFKDNKADKTDPYIDPQDAQYRM